MSGPSPLSSLSAAVTVVTNAFTGGAALISVLPLLGPALVFVSIVVIVFLIIASCQENLAQTTLGDKCAEVSSANIGYPVGPEYVKEASAGFGPEHKGLDFDQPAGKPVLAVADGTVLAVMRTTGTTLLIIQHGGTFQSWYKFLDDDVRVKEDQQVKRGQTVAESSGIKESSGSRVAHVHVEVHVSASSLADPGEAIDPAPLMHQATGSSNADLAEAQLSGKDNPQKAFNFFVSKGYTEEQSAGIVGNMLAESGVLPMRLQNTPPFVQTRAVDVQKADLGWGIVQWTKASKFVDPLITSGVEPAKIESLAYQLTFLASQLEGETFLPEGKAGDAVKAARTVEEAAHAFGDVFEKFDGHENSNHPTYAVRKRLAKEPSIPTPAPAVAPEQATPRSSLKPRSWPGWTPVPRTGWAARRTGRIAEADLRGSARTSMFPTLSVKPRMPIAASSWPPS